MQPRIEKVVVNIGVGAGGASLENARILLEKISGQKSVATKARVRNPSFKIRKGEEIGAKVTLRGAKAKEFLEKALDAVDFVLKKKSFDDCGNVSFGVREYIDFPGIKYDPKIGMLGFDVCVVLTKPGARVVSKRIASAKIPRKQRVSRSEAIDFLTKNFKVRIEESE